MLAISTANISFACSCGDENIQNLEVRSNVIALVKVLEYTEKIDKRYEMTYFPDEPISNDVKWNQQSAGDNGRKISIEVLTNIKGKYRFDFIHVLSPYENNCGVVFKKSRELYVFSNDEQLPYLVDKCRYLQTMSYKPSLNK